MPKPKVAMYGLTTEGYKLAGTIVDKAEVTIIDETLQMALELNSTFMKKNPDLGEMMGGEPLLSFKPLEQVLGGADVVFFTPKLRRPVDESLVEANSKLREAAKYLSKGVVLVNTLPTGPGGKSEHIMLLEKQTGLKIGDTMTYAYAPLMPDETRPRIVSSTERRDGNHLDAIGLAPSFQNIFSAELQYTSEVLGSAIGSVTQIELSRRAREAKVSLQREDDEFIDQFAKYLYDLRAIQAGEGSGESIAYLAGATLKSLENFVRYVVDEARDVLKEKELKASRTRVTLLWDLDKYEMRNDRLQMAGGIQQRLKDYVTDVDIVGSARLTAGGEVLDPLKHNVVIVCSKHGYESIKKSKGRRGVDVTVIRASPSLKRE